MLTKTATFRLALAALLLGLCLAALQQGIAQGSNKTSVTIRAASDSEGTDPNCRYGVAVVRGGTLPAVSLFRAGWYLTFEAETPPDGPADSEFVRVLNVKQNKDSLGGYLPGWYLPDMTLAAVAAVAQANPGSLWLVGNEVDRGPDPGEIEGGQGDMHPYAYAEAYHDLYHFIKEADPTARIGISALVEVTPIRLAYLDMVWQEYYEQFGTYIPVDVWNMHLYVLPEANPAGVPNAIANQPVGTQDFSDLLITESYDPDGGGPMTPADSCPLEDVYCYAEHDDLDIFKDQIVAMRSWMKQHWQQNKPLILSEYSILYPHEDDGPTCFIQDEFGQCFTPERVSHFADATLDYMQSDAIDPQLGYPADNYRLVQQWLWFAVYNTGIGETSNLVEEDFTTLTPAGQTFLDAVNAVPSTVNLWPSQVPPQWIDIVPPATAANATLSVLIRNNGNKLSPPFTVTFYRDSNLDHAIGSTVVTNARGCGRDDYLATTTWNNLAAGVHPFWVKVDSTNAIPETNEGDNVATGLVIVDGHQLYLPAVRVQP